MGAICAAIDGCLIYQVPNDAQNAILWTGMQNSLKTANSTASYAGIDGNRNRSVMFQNVAPNAVLGDGKCDYQHA